MDTEDFQLTETPDKLALDILEDHERELFDDDLVSAILSADPAQSIGKHERELADPDQFGDEPAEG